MLLICLLNFHSGVLGLNAYLDYTNTLEDLLVGTTTVKIEVDWEEVELGKGLAFIEGERFIHRGKEVGNFEIKCRMKGQKELQMILNVRDVPMDIYDLLKKDIPRLDTNYLYVYKILGRELYEGLLKATFPILEPEVKLLKDAVDKLGPEFIQAVALSYETPIEQAARVWQESLPYQLPFADLPAKADPLYSKSIEDIIADHQGRYPRLKIVRGLEKPEQIE